MAIFSFAIFNTSFIRFITYYYKCYLHKSQMVKKILKKR
nr:MAG TPA: hypothetical protein [Bacteriophage sp.]